MKTGYFFSIAQRIPWARALVELYYRQRDERMQQHAQQREIERRKQAAQVAADIKAFQERRT